MEYYDLFTQGKITVDGCKPLQVTETLKQLRQSFGSTVACSDTNYEIIKVNADFTATAPERSLIPFEITESLGKRLAEFKEEFGPKPKKQRTQGQGDILPRQIDGNSLPAGCKVTTTWPIELAGNGGKIQLHIARVSMDDGACGTYLHNSTSARITVDAHQVLASGDGAIVKDLDVKAADPSRPHWPFVLDEKSMLSYLGVLDELPVIIAKARDAKNLGEGARLYNHNLSNQAVRRSVGQYKVIPHAVKSPRPVFQFPPGDSIAQAFTLSDCGYDEDCILQVAWSMVGHSQWLCPKQDVPFEWIFAKSVSLTPNQYIHLRQ